MQKLIGESGRERWHFDSVRNSQIFIRVNHDGSTKHSLFRSMVIMPHVRNERAEVFLLFYAFDLNHEILVFKIMCPRDKKIFILDIRRQMAESVSQMVNRGCDERFLVVGERVGLSRSHFVSGALSSLPPCYPHNRSC